MEFVQGADLEALMQTHEPLTLQQKLDVIIDVLSGLTFAHKRGIVHRDIKPANIRIAEDGRAKLMDFGVAHLTSSQLTSTGASLGTPVYMSPEQITGGKATPATDVFAVGAVLYELLTGCKPFDANTLQALFYKILTEKPKPLREAMPGLPSALDHIVEKAMAKDAPQRYQSALDMANDLSGVRAMLSGPSYPSSVSLSATVEHAIRRSKQAAKVRMVRRELFAGGVLAAVLVIALGWWQLKKGDDRATTTASAGSRAAPVAPDSAASAPAAAAPAPATISTPPAVAPRIDSAARPAVTEPAPKTEPASKAEAASKKVERPTPKPERPAPSQRVARNTSPTPATKPAASDARQPSAPPPRTAPGSSASAPTTVAVAPQTVTTQPSVTPPTVTQPTVQQGIVAPRPAPSTAQSQPEAPPPAPAPPTAADVTPVLEAYARAIESRDVSAIRRVYPGLTADQQHGFEQFFESARKINVTFRVTSVEGTATTADVRVTGRYEYETSAGHAERQTIGFAAALKRDGSAWRLVSLR
jgi:serine/threonine-protein kinase